MTSDEYRSRKVADDENAMRSHAELFLWSTDISSEHLPDDSRKVPGCTPRPMGGKIPFLRPLMRYRLDVDMTVGSLSYFP